MEADVLTNRSAWTEVAPGISWPSVLAGAFVIAAVSLPLLALGAGLGLASVSPWSGSSVAGSTFTNITGAYLVVVAVMSSAIGGYFASRLRSKWTDLHNNEVFFRDSAHGFVAWAFATVLSASLLATEAAYLVGGTALGIGATGGSAAPAGQSASPNAVFVDRLFRTEGTASQSPTGDGAANPGMSSPPAGGASPAQRNNDLVKAEVGRLWATTSFADGSGLQSADRSYIAHLVAQQTGLGEADAEKRVDDVINETKNAIDRARVSAMKLSFWTVVALLFGAFAASLAAVEGGQHRDGSWSERRLVPRSW